MNLPNKLTLLRVIMVPVFVIFMMLPADWGRWAALAVFIIASLTDTADGYIARKYNMITDFGKFMDPLADKILVYAAFCLMVADHTIPAWTLIIILCREFLVAGIRTVAASEGIVIAADMAGKIKTVLQMVATCLLIIAGYHIVFYYGGYILFYASLAMTVYSGINYCTKNIEVFKD